MGVQKATEIGVPERWPLARLSFSLQTCVDHLDRVLAGCCWEVQATRTTPSESLLSLYQVAKCLTMKLAVHLAKEVAAILRAVLTHETKKLYNDSTVHLLCSNSWIQPIYQELLHSSSRYNATREGERKRPSSGLARVAACPKPPKQRKPSASGTGFSDWIGGTCYADTSQVWFPAHWAPVVLQQLQQKEDNYRTENPSWMDQEEAPADILKQWQEARANRRMQFKVGNYRDGSWESNIRMLTGTIKLIGYSCQLSRTSLHFLRCNKVSLLGYSGRWVPPPGELLGRRSCNSQYSSPMICLWRIGMQGCMAYQPFGLRLLCWVLTICAKLLAMIFIS